MDKKQYKKILEDAEETLESLDGIKGDFTKEQYLLYGASLAVIDHDLMSKHENIPEKELHMDKPIIDGFLLPQTFSDFERLVKDELHDAEKYYSYYNQSGEESYRQLSKQELSHLAYFIEKARSASSSPEHNEKIKDWKRKHDAIYDDLK